MSSIVQPDLRSAASPDAQAGLTDIYVDLDGTLVKADVSVESFVRFLIAAPFNFVRLFLWLLRGRSVAKAMVARSTILDVALLPYRTELIDYLKDQRRRGRRLILATASHRRYASRIARHLDIFDDVLATTAKVNLKGRRKASAIQLHCHNRPFAYVGDSKADVPVWRAAQLAIVVGSLPAIEKELRGADKLEWTLKSQGSPLKALWKAIRPHQWVKNSLLLVPLLTSHRYDSLNAVAMALLGMVLFCAAASATYLINDILDVESDRAHHRKRRRPIASGSLSVGAAIVAAIGLLAGGLIASFLLMPFLFTFFLLLYAVTTTAYSIWLKRLSTIDVVALAGLYTLRIIAGAAAVNVDPSFWLLAFSMFLFASLAFLKRYTEVARLAGSGETSAKGRGYYSDDSEALFTLGAATGMLSVLVLALYINSPLVQAQYATPFLIWGICPCALMWVSRIWLAARRGEVHDDPIVHALRDKSGLLLVAVCAILVLAAQSGWVAHTIIDSNIWRAK